MGNLAAVLRFIEEQRSENSAQTREFRPLVTGWSGVDAALGGKCHADGLHEWFGAARGWQHHDRAPPLNTRQDVGSPRAPLNGRVEEVGTAHPTYLQRRDWSPPISILAHLAHAFLTPDAGPRWALWIGKSCFPYPHILARGVMSVAGDGHNAAHDREDDASLLHNSIFVAISEPALRLWAADLAVRCRAVGIVIVDGSRFPMAATRRLQLLARTHGKPILSARPPWERGELSAAQTRWQVYWAPGPSCIPRWSVELLRCKGLQPENAPRWVLERTRATGRIDLLAELAGDAGQAEIRAAAAGRTA